MEAEKYLKEKGYYHLPECVPVLMEAYNRRTAELLEYLYACHSSGANLMDHVEDEIKQIIEDL